jgi:tetratricopeptide (TPR) repeat protein
MKPRRRALATVSVLLVVGALVGAAAAVANARERRYPPPAESEATLYIQSGTLLQRLTKGYNALAADLYWIRAIQYYGGHRLEAEQRPSESFPQLYPLLDLTTSLDPYFNIAYRFGSIFLAEPPPGGPGRPDLAVSLLEKGLRVRPDKWEYMQDIGFVYYWWAQDYQKAADWFDRAGAVPGAPWFLRALAATTRAEGGDLRTSRAMWESIRATAEIDFLRNESERRLTQIDAMEFMEGLQQKVDMVKSRAGEPPSDWAALINAGLIPGTPLDPTGVPYVIDASGTVQVSQASRLYPLPSASHRSGPS